MPAKRKKVEPEATITEKPATVDVLITKACPNPTWVIGVDKNGKQYKIRIPARYVGKLLHKPLTVKAIDGELEEYYKYEP